MHQAEVKELAGYNKENELLKLGADSREATRRFDSYDNYDSRGEVCSKLEKVPSTGQRESRSEVAHLLSSSQDVHGRLCAQPADL